MTELYNEMKQTANNQSGIFYLQADINYTTIHYCDGSKLISSSTLKKYEFALKEHGFLRINKSQLVNPQFIESVEMEKTFCLIRLTNGQHFKSSRRKVGILKVLKANRQQFLTNLNKNKNSFFFKTSNQPWRRNALKR